MPPFTLTVANRKGGIGKTTTAVNLASGFAHTGRRVLLVDFDGQGHAGLGFGIRAETGSATAHSIFTYGPGALSSAIRKTSDPRIDVAPANQTLRHPGETGSPHLLRDAIAGLAPAHAYDVVIIDTPPSLDSLLVTALTAADGVLIPFLPHPLAAEGISQFARVFFEIRMAANPGLKHMALTPVQFSTGTSIHRVTVELVKGRHGAEKMTPHIRTDIKLAEAFAAGKPIFDYAPASRGAQDYAALCGWLSMNWPLPGARL